MDVSLEPKTDDSSSILSRIRISYPLTAMTCEALQRELEPLQKRGVQSIVLRRQQLLRIGADRVQHCLEATGLTVDCLGFSGGFTGTMSMSYEDAVSDTRRTIRLAKSIGARRVVVLPGGQGTHISGHAEQTIRMGLQDVAPYAESHDVRLLIPTNSVFNGSRDHFQPRCCPLQWITSMKLSAVQPLILLRGRSTCRRLPRGWKTAMDRGGVIRICPRCPCYDSNVRRLFGVLQFLDRQSELTPGSPTED